VREVVHHPGSAVILPAFQDGTIALVRQYRHPAVRYLLSCRPVRWTTKSAPRGRGRELEEELVVSGQPGKDLAEFFCLARFLRREMWLYLATDLTETQQRLKTMNLIRWYACDRSRSQMITDARSKMPERLLD